ncbi:unnamed protein product [Tetraodon nigroviridis]|uniref:(spotted green pufferfish) hypothetical protein n=1 Tax=Tetraodon nigroviridis TaxID=99883 RepID=Q4S1R8_TETNG|nr:unnamed protein product [Tetraodon nigroviridis]
MLQLEKLLNPGRQGRRAVIVSVGEFYPQVGLQRRPGASRDAKRLHKTLMKMGFKVDIHQDLSSGEIYELFEQESRRPVEDCFLAVLSSHGEEGCVYGWDGEPVQLSHIFAYFDNKCMEKKTKVFLIQACRGDALDDGVEVDAAADADADASAACVFQQCLSVPLDTVVMYATAPGYAAFMNAAGSPFFKAFCDLLLEDGQRDLELTRLLTRVSHRLAYTFQARGPALDGKKEMPWLLTRMTREAFPFAEPGKTSGASGLSATSLVHDATSMRARTPSIS